MPDDGDDHNPHFHKYDRDEGSTIKSIARDIVKGGVAIGATYGGAKVVEWAAGRNVPELDLPYSSIEEYQDELIYGLAADPNKLDEAGQFTQEILGSLG